MRVAWRIVRRDLVRLRRAPARTAFLFALPLTLASIFALVFGGGGEAIRVRLLLQDDDGSLLSRFLAGAASSEESGGRLEVIEVDEGGVERIEAGEAAALLRVPQGFTDDLLAGRPTALEVVKNPAQRFLPQVVEEGAGIVAVVLSEGSRLLRSELSLLDAMLRSEGFPAEEAVAALSTGILQRAEGLEAVLFPPVIGLETTTVGAAPEREVDLLSVFLPGLSLMGILFLAQAATRDIHRERESGLLRQLLTAPVSTGDYLLGKCMSALVVTLGGFAVLVAFGLALGGSWGSPLPVAALVVASSVAVSGLLLLLMSVVGSERQGDAITTIVIMGSSMVGGAFIPLPALPEFVLPISRATVTYWAASGFNRLTMDGGGALDVLPNVLVLLAAGAVFLACGAALLQRRFARGEV